MEDKQNDIILPKELASGRFNLEEIGAIVVLMCLPTMNLEDMKMWSDHYEFTDCVDSLIKDGTATKVVEDGILSLSINI